MRTTALLLSAALLASAPALADDAAAPAARASAAPPQTSTPARATPGTMPADPSVQDGDPTLAAATADEATEERDRWTTVAVVTVLATAVVAVAAGALLASYTPPCDASLGCTTAP